MELNKTVNIKNRGTAEVGYTLPDTGVRRTWTPNEIKKNITINELEQLTYIPGGQKLLEKYLVVNDKEVCEYLGLHVEPEYFYDENTILTLLNTGTLDQLLDCLDFAPGGVLDLIKKISVDIKLNDVSKRKAIREKLGFDITRAIENVEYATSPDTDAQKEREATVEKGRRTTPIEETKNTGTGRRTAPVASKEKETKTPVYNRVK